MLPSHTALRKRIESKLQRGKSVRVTNLGQIIAGLDDNSAVFDTSIQYVCDAFEFASQPETSLSDVVRAMRGVADVMNCTACISDWNLRDELADCWIDVLKRCNGLAPTIDLLLGFKPASSCFPLDDLFEPLVEIHGRELFKLVFSRWTCVTAEPQHSLTVIDFLLRARSTSDIGLLFQDRTVRVACFDSKLVASHLDVAWAAVNERYPAHDAALWLREMAEHAAP